MLTVTYRKHGVRLSHVYFADSEQVRKGEFKKKAGDLVFLHGASIPPDKGELLTTQNTLIKDLNASEEQLFLTMGKHLRKHIRKSEREDLVKIKFYESQDILDNEDILDTCKYLYEKMFKDKGMQASFNTKLAKRYCRCNALVVAMAYLEGEPVGFCAVIYSGENARAWVGAFDYRNEDRDGYVMSRGHRRLNWERMLWCKEHGVKYFDFGGINSFDEPNAIAKFKIEFESQGKVTYKNYLVPTNLIGKIALGYFMKKWRG